MLLTLLTVLSSVTMFASAVLAAKHQHAALGGYLLAIVIGALLALCNGWIVDKAGCAVGNLSNSTSNRRQEWRGKVFFVAILLWLPCAAFVGNWAALTVMRFAS